MNFLWIYSQWFKRNAVRILLYHKARKPRILKDNGGKPKTNKEIISWDKERNAW